MGTRTWTGLVVTSLLLAVSCSAPESPAARMPVVAAINGTAVPLSAFESYLAVHFVEEPLEEPVSREDTEHVQSRLFDDFIEESLLVLEAERRGVQVDPAEITAWLGDQADPDPARESARKDQARRELLARHLLDAWMRAEAKVGSGDAPPDIDPDAAAARLIASLRARYPVAVHTEVLPFHYTAEANAAPAKP